VHDPGAVLNGFHETWPIVYPEDAHGLARTSQTVVNAPDPTVIRLLVDGEPFDPATARVARYERVLDLRAGVLAREVEYVTRHGARMLVRSRRLASLEHRHLAAMRSEVVALDAAVRIAVVSELVTHDPRRTADDPRRGTGFAEKPLVPLDASAGGTRSFSSRPATAACSSRAASSTPSTRRPTSRSPRRPRATGRWWSCARSCATASGWCSPSTRPISGPSRVPGGPSSNGWSARSTGRARGL
jgi:hypothetical protein